MTIATEIRGALVGDGAVFALVGERVDPDILAQDALMPAVVYSLATGQREQTLKGSCDLFNGRYQFDCYADTAMQADELRAAVAEALEQTPMFKVVRGLELDLYENDTKRYRRTVEFSIWRNDRSGSP